MEVGFPSQRFLIVISDEQQWNYCNGCAECNSWQVTDMNDLFKSIMGSDMQRPRSRSASPVPRFSTPLGASQTRLAPTIPIETSVEEAPSSVEPVGLSLEAHTRQRAASQPFASMISGLGTDRSEMSHPALSQPRYLEREDMEIR